MIVMYKGRRGAGKTLTLVKDAFTYYKNGWEIVSNFHLPFASYMDDKDIMAIDKTSDIRKVVLCIDEIQIFFDSRRGMAKGNLTFSNFIQQIRKRGIILLCTTQFSNTVDLRLRQHLDVIATPNFIDKYPVVAVKYIDLTSIEDEWVTEPVEKTVVYDPRPIFGLYDTEELIL
jgi:hypothetical protein